MMKKVDIIIRTTMNKQENKLHKLFCMIVLFLPMILQGQNNNYNNNTNQNTVIINNTPVVERTKVVEKVKTVVIEKPASKPKRHARKLSFPVCVLNSLWIYTEDLGCQSRYSAPEIIEMLNRTEAYGRNDWRIPTEAELSLMMQNADVIGLGDGPYLFVGCGYEAVLRPVSTGLTTAQQNALQRQAEMQERARRERERIAQEQQEKAAARREILKKIEQERRDKEAYDRAIDALY